MPALLIAGFLFVPFYWRSGVYTIPEFLGRRYNEAVRFALALCWGLILVTNLAIMLYATSVLLRSLMGWSPLFSIWLTVVVIGCYTISGGLGAVVMTDVLQVCVMFVGGDRAGDPRGVGSGRPRRHARRRPRARARVRAALHALPAARHRDAVPLDRHPARPRHRALDRVLLGQSTDRAARARRAQRVGRQGGRRARRAVQALHPAPGRDPRPRRAGAAARAGEPGRRGAEPDAGAAAAGAARPDVRRVRRRADVERRRRHQLRLDAVDPGRAGPHPPPRHRQGPRAEARAAARPHPVGGVSW